MALGSIQPPTEMSTRNIYWGCKGDRCVGLTILPPSCADCHESRSLNLLEPSGHVRGLFYLYPFSFLWIKDYQTVGCDQIVTITCIL